MKNTLPILLLSILLWSCSKDSPYSVEFQAETEIWTSLDVEIASFLDLTFDETGLISKVTEQIRIRKLDDADLNPDELIARLEIPEKELILFAEKLSTFQAVVERNGYSQEQVSVALKTQMRNRLASFEKNTPCYNVHETEVLAATVAMVACNALAAATGGWGIFGCGVAYVGVVGTSRVKYENCINK